MTIAELDCEAHHAICKAEGIMGYPQLYLSIQLLVILHLIRQDAD